MPRIELVKSYKNIQYLNSKGVIYYYFYLLLTVNREEAKFVCIFGLQEITIFNYGQIPIFFLRSQYFIARFIGHAIHTIKFAQLYLWLLIAINELKIKKIRVAPGNSSC